LWQGLVSRENDAALLSLPLDERALISPDQSAEFAQLAPVIRLAVALATLLLRGSRSK
jgi:hypothetical protein